MIETHDLESLWSYWGGQNEQENRSKPAYLGKMSRSKSARKKPQLATALAYVHCPTKIKNGVN